MYNEDIVQVINHLCRAFLSPYFREGGIYKAHENDTPVFTGRFNIGACTLNLIMIYQKAFRMFKIMKYFASRNGYNIDIMSGYRSYDYQDKIYNKLVNQKGFNYAFRYIATAGASEHQSGLAIDICIYRDNKCYIEHEIADFKEIKWLHKNAHKFGFILRYKLNKEDITGYNYEPWHFRYVGNMASYIYYNNLVLEEL